MKFSNDRSVCNVSSCRYHAATLTCAPQYLSDGTWISPKESDSVRVLEAMIEETERCLVRVRGGDSLDSDRKGLCKLVGAKRQTPMAPRREAISDEICTCCTAQGRGCGNFLPVTSRALISCQPKHSLSRVLDFSALNVSEHIGLLSVSNLMSEVAHLDLPTVLHIAIRIAPTVKAGIRYQNVQVGGLVELNWRL